MRFATLISWLVTASLGAFMLRTWLVRDGLRRERAKQGGLPPQLIFGHATAAIVGLLGWAAFVASGARPFAWAAVVLLMAAVGLGLCTVILWTPYPARKPGIRRSAAPREESVPDCPPEAPVPQPEAPVPQPEGPFPQPEAQDPPSREVHPAFEVTDEMIAQLLADPVMARRPSPSLIPLTPAVAVPIAHGFAAMCTLLLAVMSAIT